jgi:predicted HicB family RNase H-like nuclease
MSRFKYKGLSGSVEFNHRERLFEGYVQELKSKIAYKGKSIRILKEKFKSAVDKHLETQS